MREIEAEEAAVSAPKIQRSQSERISALGTQLEQLRRFASALFVAGDRAYLGDVALKLRLLATEFGSNVPLLLSLMDETAIQLTMTLGGPPVIGLPEGQRPGDILTLRQYMLLPAMYIRTSDNKLSEVSKTNFVRTLAEQFDGAHSDRGLN